jgi:hypothetical protein
VKPRFNGDGATVKKLSSNAELDNAPIASTSVVPTTLAKNFVSLHAVSNAKNDENEVVSEVKIDGTADSQSLTGVESLSAGLRTIPIEPAKISTNFVSLNVLKNTKTSQNSVRTEAKHNNIFSKSTSDYGALLAARLEHSSPLVATKSKKFSSSYLQKDDKNHKNAAKSEVSSGEKIFRMEQNDKVLSSPGLHGTN